MNKGNRAVIIALVVILCNMLFYVSMFLLFLPINKEVIIVVSIIIWALCATCCCSILAIARMKKQCN